MDQERTSHSPQEVLSETASEVAFLDFNFIKRIYRTSTIVMVILGFMLWGSRFGLKAAVGLVIGTTASLAMLWSLEWGVRRFISAERRSTGALLGLSALKMLLIGSLLVGAFLAAREGWVGLLWVLVGFTVPHAVLILKIIGLKVNEAMNGTPARRRN